MNNEDLKKKASAAEQILSASPLHLLSEEIAEKKEMPGGEPTVPFVGDLLSDEITKRDVPDSKVRLHTLDNRSWQSVLPITESEISLAPLLSQKSLEIKEDQIVASPQKKNSLTF